MKKALFVIGSTFLITALALNINISLSQNESSDVSISTLKKAPVAQAEDKDGDGVDDEGFIEDKQDCSWSYSRTNPFTGEEEWYIAYGESATCRIDWINLGCEEYSCREN